ncbi:MAG: hypothetical protein KatS3mg003_1991 [Candidatus Nitrosocaldaceae archaeon]|nr:MAG: hypothetical protein KatS3mg003_1991 [Candidatus Nitrosocaldaceae archaeon]
MEFFDWDSENLSNNIPKYGSRCMLDVTDIRIAQGYVTSKIINKYGRYVNINIQPGRPGIVLQDTLFNPHVKYKDAYLITTTSDNKKLIRKLPVEGFSDWLLIYDEILFVEIIKGGCEEIEVVAV